MQIVMALRFYLPSPSSKWSRRQRLKARNAYSLKGSMKVNDRNYDESHLWVPHKLTTQLTDDSITLPDRSPRALNPTTEIGARLCLPLFWSQSQGNESSRYDRQNKNGYWKYGIYMYMYLYMYICVYVYITHTHTGSVASGDGNF